MTATQPLPQVLEEKDRLYLRKLVEEKGLHAVATLLIISRGVISSAVAGIPIRRGSIELLREALIKQRGVK